MTRMTEQAPNPRVDQVALRRRFPVAVCLVTIFVAAIWVGVMIGISVGEDLSLQASRSWCNTVVESALQKFAKQKKRKDDSRRTGGGDEGVYSHQVRKMPTDPPGLRQAFSHHGGMDLSSVQAGTELAR